MISKILDNRYEIIKEIGTGGMARVFLARCKLLNRNVAVKVLRPEFANDEEFVARFNIEAQAAASLSHPNIVSIYDVGKVDDLKYIVMEYVEGQTLKQYIDDNKLLSWQQCIDFSIQICKGLEHAHKNGIIHRDIKPHNIILTTEGVLKVTDFGIARASTAATVTMGGNTIGSVHYFSPEQARGGYTDAKSDIYSLGVVMYEMITGRVPFESDSPVSVAIKHIQEKPVSPKEYNIAVPLAVEAIILKAMSKEQSMRYQSASEMLVDLISAQNQQAIAPQTQAASDNNSETIKIPTRQVEKEISKKTKKESEKKTIVWAVVTSFLIVGLLIFGTIAVINPALFSGASAEMAVPDLVGKDFNEVKDFYKAKKITITKVSESADKALPKDAIIEQNPKPGKMIKPPIEITVVVSLGQKDVIIENYVNKPFSEVKIAVEKSGLVPFEVKENSDTVPQGVVIRTTPSAGLTIKEGEQLTVYVSEGKADVKLIMPNLVGEDIAQARRIIAGNNLRESTTVVPSDKPKDTVLTQSVQKGESVSEYTEINLTVSSGKQSDSPSTTDTAQKSRSITITVPQNKDKTLIKVVQDGSVIHNATHNKDEKAFNVKIVGSGSVKIEIFYDNSATPANSTTVKL